VSASRSLSSILSGDLITSDTGVLQTQRQTLTKSVAPSWTWKYTERTQLQVTYQMSDVSFGNSQSVGLFDYKNRSATVTLSNQLSERSRVFVTGGYSRFQVALTGFESNTGNVQIGGTRNFSETMSGTLQAGLRNTESITQGGNPTGSFFDRFDPMTGQIVREFVPDGGVTQDSRRETTSSVFSGNLEKKFEKASVRLAVSRTLNPSSSGGQTEQDAVSFNLRNPLTPRLTLSVNANRQETDIFEGNISNNDRTYSDFSSGIDWRWTRDWSVGMDYRYARVNREFENAAVDSNSVGLVLTYRPVKMAISR
jgi:hypothetical protein